MKVIDLLNKIANGEEVPEQIKIQGCTYYLCKDDNSGQCYFSEKQGFGGFGLKFNTSQLDEEVEIIEEKKSLTKADVEALGYAFGEMRKALQNGWNKSLNNEPFKEDEKIEKIDQNDRRWHYGYNKKTDENVKDNLELLREKVNEIIDHINKGDK